MTASHIQTGDAQIGIGASVNVTLTGVVAAHHLCASTEAFNSGATGITSVTSSPSATWSNVANGSQDQTGGGLGSGHQSTRIDYTENVASGSWTITHHANSSSSITGHVTESAGVATSASIGTSAGATSGTSAVASQAAGSITPTAGSILISAWASSSANTAAPTVNNSFVLRSDATGYSGTNERAGQATLDNAANSAVNVQWTESSGTSQQIATVAEFLAAGGGGGGGMPFFFEMDNKHGNLTTQNGGFQ